MFLPPAIGMDKLTNPFDPGITILFLNVDFRNAVDPQKEIFLCLHKVIIYVIDGKYCISVIYDI